jgi:hypothetical protein
MTGKKRYKVGSLVYKYLTYYNNYMAGYTMPPIYLHLVFGMLQFEISSLMNCIFSLGLNCIFLPAVACKIQV